jgi:hypothetical protein
MRFEFRGRNPFDIFNEFMNNNMGDMGGIPGMGGMGMGGMGGIPGMGGMDGMGGIPGMGFGGIPGFGGRAGMNFGGQGMRPEAPAELYNADSIVTRLSTKNLPTKKSKVRG